MRILLYIIVITVLSSFTSVNKKSYYSISKKELEDKVRGAWAAKMIGVIYGRDMEFKAVGKTYDDTINWQPEMVERALLEDDLYGQLSFMHSIEKYGEKFTVQNLATDFANASFPLCHANLQARKNIFDGLKVPHTGSPQYSMHADDIDFQIESDFIGFIHPGMPLSTAAMSDSIGRIMAYGDGLYGGVFVSTMHSLAYFENNVEKIVRQALKSIPANSSYSLIIQDVITLYEKDSNNWRSAWNFIENKWAKDDICVPYHDFNIDAKLNGAYIAIGLLYGKGDLQKTMEIAIRCGQDTDCNSANAAAVLGIIYGYQNIPENFKSHIPSIADKNFLHTESSYNTAIKQSINFIENNILKHGGAIELDSYLIKSQIPVFKGKMEQSYPDKVMNYQVQVADQSKWKFFGKWEDFRYGDGDNDLYQVSGNVGDSIIFNFEGTGISLLGSWNNDGGMADIYIDDKFVKTIDVYFREEAGKYDVNRAHIFHDMNLKKGSHKVKLIISKNKNKVSKGNKIWIERAVVYKDKSNK